MAITTHYGNVPIAPTNVATDSVRNENEHKKPIPPPKSVSEIHKERAIDPEREHDAEQGQQHSSQQQETLEQKPQEQEPEIQKNVTSSITGTAHSPYPAALKRSDIHIGAEPPIILDHDSTTQVAPTEAKNVRQQLNKVYQEKESPPRRLIIDEEL
ncbi:hypothetical protein [Parashewanella tropica]|uniref:hypothetical protein n=1 Tax=Parashewanella tropica TaxID=2547970 RepID=UPI00105A7A88|nr:hypothetical protein [Parashewanella tropica]